MSLSIADDYDELVKKATLIEISVGKQELAYAAYDQGGKNKNDKIGV